MSDFQLLQHGALAVAIGLLIGIQRGWQEREAHDGARVAGIRTFTLISMIGAASGLIGGANSAIVTGACFLGFALPFGLFEYRRSRVLRTHSATNFVTGLLTFALGAYAMEGRMAIAAALGIAATVILAERHVLHAFVRRLKWTELRAAILLLVMTGVLLPALPNRPVDPWGAINPYQIWLMTVLVGVISYAGYIAIRIAGERKGLLFAGLTGGLVTSTTVTWTFARIAKRDGTAFPEVFTAILGAWIVSLLRMTVIAISISPLLAAELLPPIGAASLVLMLPAIGSYFMPATSRRESGLVLQNPFDLSLMMKFLLVLVVIMLLSKFAARMPGQGSLLALGGLSGAFDVDPITLSSANMSLNGLQTSIAVRTILIAATANATAKAVLGAAFGGLRMGIALGASAILAIAAGIFFFPA
jgi:uncharacterized membrane protein (DUF4010 family)